MLPENRLLMNHSYGLFSAHSAYFSNGVQDPRTEVRLLTRDTLEPVPEPARNLPPSVSFVGMVDDNPGVLKLSPVLQIESGHQYLLDFEFGPHPYAGILQLAGKTFFREYALPQTGAPKAFGTASGNAKSLSLWTTSGESEAITLRYIPTDGSKPMTFADFARFRLRKIDPADEPVAVTSLLPFRATVHAGQDAWLETPRVSIPGYTATVDGQPVEIRRSPEGLVMIPVSPSTHAVEIRYSGPVVLRLAYGITLTAWLALMVLVPFCRFRRSVKY